MTPEMSGAFALILCGLALILGQRNSILRAFGGFLIALLLLSASSLGADGLNAAPEAVRATVAPGFARFFVCALVLALLALTFPQFLASADQAWITWNMLAISEVSSLVYRGGVFRLEDLIISGIAAILILTLASISATRIWLRRQPNRF